MCAAPAFEGSSGIPRADEVCGQLVRTLAMRVGLVTAAVTAVLVLTVAGLSRIVTGPDGDPADGRAESSWPRG